MKRIVLFTVTGIMLSLSSCINFMPCIEGRGDFYDEYRDVSNFLSVSNTTSFDVYVAQADTFSVVVNAQENLLPIIETERIGNTLIIKTRDFSCIRNSGVEVYVSMPEIEELSVTGSGMLSCGNIEGDLVELTLTGSGRLLVDSVFCEDIQLKNTASGNLESVLIDSRYCELDLSGSGRLEFGEFYGPNFEIDQSSSGSIRGGVFEVNETDISLSGSGTIVIQGDSRFVHTSHTSSGRIDILDLHAVDVTCRATGSGPTFVTVSGVLDVSITGSGNIIYAGNPTEIYSTITGSGDLRIY